MVLTKLQEEGLRIAVERYKEGALYTVIAGLSGVGKSTLVHFIIEALDFDPTEVAYITPTGKAAQVLRSKGCPNAMTIHKFLYKYSLSKNMKFYRKPKESFELSRYKLIVVDEVSMIEKKMWNLLLSHHIYVIACGDPFQLPALTESCTVLKHPHIFLTEIMRQALESEIIRLSLDIRNRKPLRPYMGKEINILRRRDFDNSMLEWANQTLCAKNETRKILNTTARKLKFGENVGKYPIKGDRLICLSNDFDVVTPDGEIALVNGLTGTYNGHDSTFYPGIGQLKVLFFSPDGATDGEEFYPFYFDWNLLVNGEPTVTKQNFKLFKSEEIRLEQFDYAYAITGHKAQGSEWPKVLVIEENFPWDPEEHARWLYTCCTRPSEKLTLILKD